MENVRVLFVLPHDCTDENDVSEVMQQAFESCRQNVINVSWVKESQFNTIDFSKTDFVVFQDFVGKNFESLKQSKCARILGPWCLLVCLMEGRPIPNFTWPIYNVAMSNCVVTSSHIVKAMKNDIKEKVQLMGGCYTDSLMSTNTHLVTESVKSEKYLQAAESGLKLFVSAWVEAVWEASQDCNIHCDNKQFEKYKCPPFHNLTISSTGFTNVEMKSQLAQTVAQNGGVFTANLAVATTDVLLVHGESGVLSKKYKAAKTNPNIYCVTIDWINDCVSKGYALPHNSYTVSKKCTSTPTKSGETGPDFSLISTIGDVTARHPSLVEETMVAKKFEPTILFANGRVSPGKRKCSAIEEVEKLIDGLDIKKAKKAGQYLDGCSVYLAGFKPDQREKLSKILNLSGATRYDDISDRLTHIIVGDLTCPEVKIIKSKNYSVSMVSVHWLLDSMEQEQMADEENYLISLYDSGKEQFSSPLGKKGLSLLRSKKTLTSMDFEASNSSTKNFEDTEVDHELMQQYRRPESKDESDTLMRLLKDNSDFNSRPNPPEESKHSTDFSSESSQTLHDRTSQDTNIFYNKKFLIVNFSTQEHQDIKQQIESVLGTVMSKSYKGIPDYVVAPAVIKAPLQVSALEIVNHYWIIESVTRGEELPISYYHRPVVVGGGDPLEHCVVCISGYAKDERNFLKKLIEALGAIWQEQLARIFNREKNIEASTHLLSLEAEGKKYQAAVKWGLPVVKKEWLFECAKTGKLVPEEGFLMGDSRAPTRNHDGISDVTKARDTPGRATPGGRQQRTPNPLSASQKEPLDISKIAMVRNHENAENRITPGRATPSGSKQLTPNPLSSKKVLTPADQLVPAHTASKDSTPVNQRLFQGVAETPCTQITPVNKIMEEIRRTNLLGTPQTPPMRKCYYDVDTPESPFGACIRPHLSPKSKKELMRYINRIPDFVPPPQRRKSTPLSEVKRRCWAKLLGTQDASENKDEPSTSQTNQEEETNSESETNDENVFIDTKLKQLEEMVNVFSETRRKSRTFQTAVSSEEKPSVKDSQPFSVGWDYEEDLRPPPKQQQIRIFMISGVENDQRDQIVEKIESLGGQVSELKSYDPKCTHLICPKPARNEKTLSVMAAGKWILHISYVDKCVAAGTFLPEENFEFGNPKAKENIKVTLDKELEMRVQSMHWWRKEISRRGYGAFNDMRAIVVAERRDPIVRVIEAGGGQVLDVSPPFKDTVHITHCFMEVRSVSDFSLYNPLAQQGVLCINTLYISDFLFRTNKDVKDAILPHFSRFYT